MSPNDQEGAADRRETIAEDLAHLYDQVVDDYVKVFFDDLTDAPWLDEFISHVPPGGRILDVGCGPGNFSAYLAKKDYRLTGIDISPKMIEAAKKLVPSAEFEVMNCAKLAYQDASFDGTFAAYSLLHLTKNDAIASIKEFHRTLADGGTLCLMLKEGTGEHNLPASLAPGKTCYVLLWNRNEVEAVLADVGFELIFTDVGLPTSEKELQFRKLLFVAKKSSLAAPQGKATCRRLEQGDIAAVTRLAESADEIQTGTSAPQFWSEDTLLRWAKSELGVLLVCDIAGEVAGFIVSSFNPISRDGYLHCLVVAPNHRRSGAGTALLRETERLLAAKGCNHVFGLVKPSNGPSERLLERSGFEKGQKFTYWQKSVASANQRV